MNKYHDLTDEDLITQATAGVSIPDTDDKQMIAELCLRLQDALYELEEVDDLMEEAGIQTMVIPVH